MSLYHKVIDLQKLNAAWEHVHKNNPSSGIDHVTCEQFHQNKKEELKQLQIELCEHTYETLPVKNVEIYKGEKVRSIALYSMRDKVVQQSLATELSRIYEKIFSNQTYAYRCNRSALSAVNEIENKIRTEKYTWVLKMDIAQFFDRIQWEQLRSVLRRSILEEDVLELIRQNVQTKILDDSGELKEKSLGIHQGSIIAPVLSNVYLLDFDLWMGEQPVYFVRYSDDMLVLSHSKEKLLSLQQQVIAHLENYGLELNQKKTRCISLNEGIDFLGYHFDESGKTIPSKAEKNLVERLETIWLTSSEKTFYDKVKKVLEIIGGWEQYFHGKREIKSIFEFTAFVFCMEDKPNNWQELKKIRVRLCNIYKDITDYLAKIWKKYSLDDMELFEYEQFYQIWNFSKDDIGEKIKELLSCYRKIMIIETEDDMTDLMQIYTDCHAYQKAAFWMQKKENAEKNHFDNRLNNFTVKQDDESELKYDRKTAAKLMNCFVGREDLFSVEAMGYHSKWKIESQLIPLTEGFMMHI